MGHIGMLPQRIREEGGYKIKGKTPAESHSLVEDAKAVEDAGAFAVVLELVTPKVADEITRSIRIPTIGIGSGKDCDGQILVFHDLVGYSPWFIPKHVHPEASVGDAISKAAAAFIAKVRR
jgi:3-methyl-2-oxobutanoate hydroxymethyltransferase